MKNKVLAVMLVLALMLGVCAPALAEAAPQAATKIVKARSIRLSRKTASLKVGSAGARSVLQLDYTISPLNATAKVGSENLVMFSSSNSKVASVDSSGLVTPVKPGKVTITARVLDGSKKKASCAVTVKGVVPEAVSLDGVSLGVGETVRLKAAILPSDAWNQGVSYVSGNKKVATVSSSGLVTALKPGRVTIKVTTKSGARAAKCSVTVTEMPGGAVPTYRFYGIGNGDYTSNSKLPSCVSDVKKMGALYQAAKADANVYTNLSGAKIVGLLSEMADNKDILPTDVTVFYYSGHGVSSNALKYRGALLGVDETFVTVGTVQYYLDKVPGRVVVILDSCLSGQFIESKGLMRSSAASFNSGVIEAFAGNGLSAKALTGSPVSGKYKILTACRSLQSSYSFTGGGKDYGVFTQAVYEGLSGSSPAADKDKDKRVALAELFSYSSSTVNSFIKRYNAQGFGNPISQTVDVWPAGDGSAVFARN